MRAVYVHVGTPVTWSRFIETLGIHVICQLPTSPLADSVRGSGDSAYFFTVLGLPYVRVSPDKSSFSASVRAVFHKCPGFEPVHPRSLKNMAFGRVFSKSVPV